MTRFIILASLLAAQFGRGISESAVYYNARSTAQFDAKETARAYKCILETNTKERHEYEYGTANIADRLKGISSIRRTCAFAIVDINYNDTGTWKLTAVMDKDNSTADLVYVYRVIVQEKKDIAPTDYVKVVESDYASLHFKEDFENVTGCNITDPLGDTHNVVYETPKDIERFGQCGVRILTNATKHTGEWTLRAIINDKIIYYSIFNLRVVPKTPKADEEVVLYMKRGTRGEIQVGPREAIFCQLVNPYGVTLPLITGRCTHKIPVVTARYDGTWIARYGVEGQMNSEEIRFKIQTYEESSLNATASTLSNGDLRLICQVYVTYSSEFCRFTRPDGAVINVSPGVGTDSYFSYANRSSRYESFACGLMIVRPTPIDYGAWKCEIEIDGKVTGTILNVDNTLHETDPLNVNARGQNVTVKLADSFTVKCIADAALDYCWLRSPNGTSYSVSRKGVASQSALTYDGAGLSLGECGATVEAANYTDQGKWGCFMGVANGTEVEAEVSVTVTETYLAADKDVISVGSGDKPTLSCRILPYILDKAVEYCRWIRPDGRGIYNGIRDRYIAARSNSHCALTITGDNLPEDIGSWTCVAGLAGSIVEEAWARVDLRHEDAYVELGALYIVLMTTCFCLTMIVCVYVMRSRRCFLQKQPPPYYVEEYVPPTVTSSEYKSNDRKF